MQQSGEAEVMQTDLAPQLASDSSQQEDVSAGDQAADDVSAQAGQEELFAQIVKQVNFYFSDANLPTDAFLLKEVQKNSEGWVPVRLIASFKRMKALSKDQNLIVAALQTSSELELSGHRVRRKAPLPVLNDTEVLLRTVIAENLPDQPTIDSLTAHFSAAGKVNMVRMCQPNGGPRSVAQTVHGADLAVSRQLHALIEYSNPQEAAAAVRQLTDSNNWRSGLKVRPLLRTAYQPKQRQQQQPRQPHKHQQQAQHSNQSAEHQTRPRQAEDGEVSVPAAPNGETSPASAATAPSAVSDGVAQLALQSPDQQGQHDSSCAQHQQDNESSSPLHEQATVREPVAAESGQEGQSMPSSKGRKAKKSKRDYAAWAGATAETRALATARHHGNPDLDDPVPSAGRPRIPKQNTPAAPGSQPGGPDGSKGFAMGRGGPLVA